MATYTDLNKIISYSQRIGTMPKKIGIRYSDKKKVGIYLDKTYKTNPSTICLGHFFLTAMRVIVNHEVGDMIPVNEEYGSIHLPSMWARFKHRGNELHGETYYIGKKKGYHDSVKIGWNNISTILLLFHNRDRVLHHFVVPNYHYTSCEDPRLYIKENGKIYMYFMNFFPADACHAISGQSDNRACLLVQEVEIKATTKKIHIGEPYTLCPSIHALKDKSDMYQVFEKNFCPFVWEKRDYVCYAISPRLACYHRDANTGICTALKAPTDDSIFYKMAKALGASHFSQTSPGIAFDNEILAVGHLRVSFKRIDEIRNVGLRHFMMDRLQEFDQGKIVLHPDVYLSFFYTFRIVNHRMEMGRFSAPFLLDYTNRKFCLDFCTTITKCKRSYGSSYLLSVGQGDVLGIHASLKKSDINDLLTFHSLLPVEHIMETYEPFLLAGKQSETGTNSSIANSAFPLSFIVENNLYNRGIETIPTKYQTTPTTLYKWYQAQKEREKWNLPDTTPFLENFQGDMYRILNHHHKPFVLLVRTEDTVKRIGLGGKQTVYLFVNESPWYNTETLFQEVDGMVVHVATGLFLTEQVMEGVATFRFSAQKPEPFTLSHAVKHTVEHTLIYETNVVPFIIDMDAHHAYKRAKLESIREITPCKVAILTMGSRASGKTSAIKKFEFNDYVSINDDEIVESHPFFHQYQHVYDMDGYRNVAPYASEITEAMYDYAIQHGLGMVIESVYPDPVRIQQLVEAGYEFILVYKITPLATIVKHRYKRMMENHMYGESFPLELVTIEQVEAYVKRFGDIPGYKGAIAL